MKLRTVELALVALLSCHGIAQAQPASAASAPANQVATLDTACGAAGTGFEWRYTKESPSRRVAVPVTRDDQNAKPGSWSKRVDSAGDWVGCRVPVPPPDCAAIEATSWGGTCSSSVTIKGGRIGQTSQVQDRAFKGRLYMQCTPTGWQPDMRPHRTYCNP